jgi:hypothetical protein
MKFILQLLEERHTADYTAESWEKVCNEWGINRKKFPVW